MQQKSLSAKEVIKIISKQEGAETQYSKQSLEICNEPQFLQQLIKNFSRGQQFDPEVLEAALDRMSRHLNERDS